MENTAKGSTHSPITGENRLWLEKSPYLLQHKDNPVHWYPWCDEAFEAARTQDKPILLSVGYATCHWCHVMERESFEDPEVAELLNEHFISIKVDREEHPDVDQIYMNAIHAMGQHGGWPMTVVLTPELKPFFGGTYFPKFQFMNVLSQLARAWSAERPRVEQVSQRLFQQIEAMGQQVGGASTLSEELLEKVLVSLWADFDPELGGFGAAPKFPPSTALRLLLRIYHRSEDTRALQMVETTLDQMARGGIHDHLGGGFARYSTDRFWRVPHFEKMLYDNALLGGTYLEAFQVTGRAMYADVARDILDYVLRDMTSEEGGFFSAEDADSEGEEGKFYVWSQEEIEEHLSPQPARRFAQLYGITASGNFEGRRNILHLRPEEPWFVKREADVAEARSKLFELREARVHPLKDDKQLTSWNGLMIDSMALAYQVLRDERYLNAAQGAASFIRQNLFINQRLKRRYRDGEARYDGTLEDYAYLIRGLLTLYQTDFQPEWIEWAIELQQQQDELFRDEKGGGYFFAARDSEALLVRNREFADSAIPSANATSALNLLELYHLTHEAHHLDRAKEIFEAAGPMLEKYPRAFAQLLIAFDFFLGNCREVAIIAPPDDAEAEEAISRFHREFSPRRVLAFGRGSSSSPELLSGKSTLNGQPTYYVCEDFRCQAPTTNLEEALTGVREREGE